MNLALERVLLISRLLLRRCNSGWQIGRRWWVLLRSETKSSAPGALRGGGNGWTTEGKLEQPGAETPPDANEEWRMKNEEWPVLESGFKKIRVNSEVRRMRDSVDGRGRAWVLEFCEVPLRFVTTARCEVRIFKTQRLTEVLTEVQRSARRTSKLSSSSVELAQGWCRWTERRDHSRHRSYKTHTRFRSVESRVPSPRESEDLLQAFLLFVDIIVRVGCGWSCGGTGNPNCSASALFFFFFFFPSRPRYVFETCCLRNLLPVFWILSTILLMFASARARAHVCELVSCAWIFWLIWWASFMWLARLSAMYCGSVGCRSPQRSIGDWNSTLHIGRQSLFGRWSGKSLKVICSVFALISKSFSCREQLHLRVQSLQLRFGFWISRLNCMQVVCRTRSSQVCLSNFSNLLQFFSNKKFVSRDGSNRDFRLHPLHRTGEASSLRSSRLRCHHAVGL